MRRILRFVCASLFFVVGWLGGGTEHDQQVMTTLIPSFTAVIAALNISLGADVGGFFLEIIAKELNAEVCAGLVVRVPECRALFADQSNISARNG